MFKLLVLADDFTGALDTGVQFAAAGVSTAVTTAPEPFLQSGAGNTQVLSVDMETRHLSPAQARERVRRLAEAIGAEFFYKKTDSGLRGNIGAELDGLLAACPGSFAAFVPAFPKAGRTHPAAFIMSAVFR